MKIAHFNKTTLALALSLMLIACGGTTSQDSDGNGSADDSTGGGTGGNNPDGGNTDTGTDTNDNTAQLGSLDDSDNFKPGVIAANQSSLGAGENATLNVALVDGGGAPLTDPIGVSFTSQCSGEGLAEIDPAIAQNTTGTISTTYTPRGCDGEDTVTATAVVDDTTLQATVTLKTEAAPPGSVLFDAADPSTIGIQGTGGTLPEQSRVSFVVTNTAGGPVPNQNVNFRLNTSVGGIELSNQQATTDANGRVSTTVSAGTVATSVRVTAETMNDVGETLTAQSNSLAITTGVPDNDSFTIGAETLNIEGGDINNITTEVTALLADRFNNPVPDGTAVTFQAEGGSIDGQCQTENGQCTVTLRSQNPRPADGRVTVLATAIGEESFVDTNGNGRFDEGEDFHDLPEAFRDDNEDGQRASNEPFSDFNEDQNYTAANGSFTGVRIGEDNTSKATSLNVRDSVVVVFSGSSLNIGAEPAAIDLDDGLQTVTITVLDKRGQVAPAGTTVDIEATQGALVGESSATQASTTANPAKENGAGRFVFRLEPGDEAGEGVLLITVTTPSGVISRGSVPVSQGVAP